MAVSNQQVADALQSHGLKGGCPMCGGTDWTAIDKFSQMPLSDEPSNMSLGGQMIPLVMIVCTGCGFISQHSAIVLGLASPQ